MTTDEMIIATCLKAGKIMVENGSEISRVDDTMMRIAQNAGVVAANTYVTITGVMMSIQGRNATQIAAVNQRTIDLEKVAQVNQLSREFAATTIDLPTLYRPPIESVRCRLPFVSIMAAARWGRASQWATDDHVSTRNHQYVADRFDWNGRLLGLLLIKSVSENQIFERIDGRTADWIRRRMGLPTRVGDQRE